MGARKNWQLKFGQQDYPAFARDMNAVAEVLQGYRHTERDRQFVFRVFRAMMTQRCASDDHPVFILHTRVVPQDTTEYRPGGSAYDLFYTKYSMTDVNIAALLRYWAKENGLDFDNSIENVSSHADRVTKE